MKRESRRSGGHDGAGSMRWLLTYSDMITLLLALFIVLFALQETQVIHFEEVARALASAFNGQTLIGKAPGPALAPGLSGVAPAQPGNARTLSHLAQRLQRAVDLAGLQQEVKITSDIAGVRVAVAADLLFPSGSAAIQPTAVPLLRKVGQILTSVPNPVEVIGNTDNQPIRTARYPSNWQLGAMRAANVTQLLAETPGLDPHRLMQASFSKYSPVASNATAAGRAQNRRVDILVLRRAVGTVIYGAANPQRVPPATGGIP